MELKEKYSALVIKATGELLDEFQKDFELFYQENLEQVQREKVGLMQDIDNLKTLFLSLSDSKIKETESVRLLRIERDKLEKEITMLLDNIEKQEEELVTISRERDGKQVEIDELGKKEQALNEREVNVVIREAYLKDRELVIVNAMGKLGIKSI